MSMSCTEGDTEGSYRNESSKTQNSYLGYVSDMDIACIIQALIPFAHFTSYIEMTEEYILCLMH
ncbi:predicted protein [Botrytis cinerea T4]|uniref:Uncharacterized protein n=1 Tax=Botryotinia fuckeliana (strain T4) TaxID=999810 RepID=G2YM47_BOTF4|nr:predicted protein [Botrytis cinerea T4]